MLCDAVSTVSSCHVNWVQVFGDEFDPTRSVVFVEAPPTMLNSIAGSGNAGRAQHRHTPRGQNEEFFLHIPQPNTPGVSAAPMGFNQSAGTHSMHSAGLMIRDPVQPDNNPGATCFRISQVSTTTLFLRCACGCDVLCFVRVDGGDIVVPAEGETQVRRRIGSSAHHGAQGTKTVDTKRSARKSER